MSSLFRGFRWPGFLTFLPAPNLSCPYLLFSAGLACRVCEPAAGRKPVVFMPSIAARFTSYLVFVKSRTTVAIFSPDSFSCTTQYQVGRFLKCVSFSFSCLCFSTSHGPPFFILSTRIILHLLFILCALSAPHQPFRISRHQPVATIIFGSEVNDPSFRRSYCTSILGSNVR